MNEPMVRIPGTTYYLQFGVEGKYYAVFLVQGRQAVKSKKLDILHGTSLAELPAEMENGLRILLEEENIYINPVVVDRVVNDLLDQVPQEGQKKIEEFPEEKRLVPETIKVSEMIQKSDDRAGRTSIIEHKPHEKPKFDATADSISHYNLRTPRPLSMIDSKVESTPVHTSSRVETSAITEKVTPQTATISVQPEKYIQLEEKIESLTNEINKMQQKIDSTGKEITNLKKQITTLKNKLKDPSSTE